MIKIKSKFILSIVLSLSLFSAGFVSNARTFNEYLGRSGEDSIYFHSTKLLFNQEYLDGIWEGLGDDGVGLWKYWGSPITNTEVTFGKSKIDFVTGDNYDFDAGCVGLTNMYDIGGTNLNGGDLDDFDGRIVYASIIMNPKTVKDYSKTEKKAILAHEVGHVLGLWHTASSSTASIMSAKSSNKGWKTSCQKEDKGDIEELYEED